MPPKPLTKRAKAPPRDRSKLTPAQIAELDRLAVRKRIYRAKNKANGKRTPKGAHRTKFSSRRASAALAETKKKRAESRAKRGLPPAVDIVKGSVCHATVLNLVGAKTLKIQRHRNKNEAMSTQEDFDRYSRSQNLNQW